MLSIIKMIIVMLSAIILNVIMLSVVASFESVEKEIKSGESDLISSLKLPPTLEELPFNGPRRKRIEKLSNSLKF
jgi:hypothetical protein